MDVFIATENIRRFNLLLQTEKGECERRLLLELLGLENEKLAAAVAAQANLIPPAAQNVYDRLGLDGQVIPPLAALVAAKA